MAAAVLVARAGPCVRTHFELERAQTRSLSTYSTPVHHPSIGIPQHPAPPPRTTTSASTRTAPSKSSCATPITAARSRAPASRTSSKWQTTWPTAPRASPRALERRRRRNALSSSRTTSRTSAHRATADRRASCRVLFVASVIPTSSCQVTVVSDIQVYLCFLASVFVRN